MENLNEEKRDQILQYLLGQANLDERLNMEEDMRTDPALGKLLHEYSQALEVLNRKWIKEDWQSTKKTFALRRFSYYMFAFVLFLGLIFTLSFGTNKSNSVAKKINKKQPTEKKLGAKQKTDSIENIFKNDTHNLDQKPPLKIAISHLVPPIFPLTIMEPQNTLLDNRHQIQYKDTLIVEQQQMAISRRETIVVNDVEEQVFYVNPNKDTTLWCKAGLGIEITANSIILTDGSLPTSWVTISVKEYLTYANLYCGKMTTTSNKKLLETGGSCMIGAAQNGEVANVAPGKNIKLHFPNTWSSSTQEMQTFAGHRDSAGAINWIPTANAKSIRLSENIDRIVLKPKLLFVTQVRYETGSTRKGKINLDTVEIFNPYFERLNGISDKAKVRFKKKLDSLQFRYIVNQNGVLQGFDYDKKGNAKSKRMLRSFSRELKNLGGDVADSISWNKYISGERYLHATVHLKNTTTLKETESGINGSKYFTIESPEFGNINCDRFTSKFSLKNFTYTVADSMNAAQAFFLDIRASMQSIASNNKITFSQIPPKSNLLVVANGTINGKAMMQIITEQNMPLNLPEPFDLQKILNLLDLVEARKPEISQPPKIVP